MKNLNIKRIFRYSAAPAALLFAACVASGSHAQSGSTYYYYDGDQRYEIEMTADEVAEFSSPGSAQQLDRSARLLKGGSGAVRIYRVDASAQQRLARGAVASSQLSPVFIQGGMRMALPGGVIVSLDPDWSDTQCRDWVIAQGSLVRERLKINSGNYYLIASGAGLASLEFANRLRGENGVLSATPNWWREVGHRYQPGSQDLENLENQKNKKQ
ncbi:MAG: hypothetical protein NXI24_18845 [bacterium]|nr:hypothetical protein [bacterium]